MDIASQEMIELFRGELRGMSLIEFVNLDQYPTNSIKTIQSLWERLNAEKEKNRIFGGKMSVLKLEQQVYKAEKYQFRIVTKVTRPRTAFVIF